MRRRFFLLLPAGVRVNRKRPNARAASSGALQAMGGDNTWPCRIGEAGRLLFYNESSAAFPRQNTATTRPEPQESASSAFASARRS